jgi:hypothetical protein
MSYVIATKLSKFIESRKFYITIADEAHYLKSRDVSNISKIVIPNIELKK